MTRKQIKTVAATVIGASCCLVLPYVFQVWDELETAIPFEGTVAKTEIQEVKDTPYKLPRWEKILVRERLDDLFWIYLDTKVGQVAFLVQSYPELTQKLCTLKPGDFLKITAAADELKRGHYFPRSVYRGEEALFTWDDMKKYYGRNHYKIMRRTGYLLLGIGLLELMYYWRAGKKPGVRSGEHGNM